MRRGGDTQDSAPSQARSLQSDVTPCKVNMEKIILKSETDTQAFAQQLADMNLTGSVWLVGDLGAGKTTLTRYWLQALGHTGAVKSPTFSLVEPYRILQQDGTIKPVYHADLYRLNDPEELEFIGFQDYFSDDSLVIIEWASRAESHLPAPDWVIDIQRVAGGEARQVTLGK